MDFSFLCPYCIERHGFSCLSEFTRDLTNYEAFCVGGECGRGVIIQMRIPKSTASPKPRIDAIGGSAFKDVDVRYIGKIEIIDSYPKPPKSRIVDNLPEMIETIFGEALLTFDEMGKTGKRADQAIFAFRKTIERALLIKFPEMQGKSLYEMIDRLKSEGKITPELASWAHKIRTIGNASVHEIVDRETEIAEAKDMEVFTRMLLIYIFTLPQMLENRKVAN